MKQTAVAAILLSVACGVSAQQDEFCRALKQDIDASRAGFAAKAKSTGGGHLFNLGRSIKCHKEALHYLACRSDQTYISLASKVGNCLTGWERNDKEGMVPDGDVPPLGRTRVPIETVFSKPNLPLKVRVYQGAGTPPIFLSGVDIYTR